MLKNFKINKWRGFVIIALLSFGIPLLITAYIVTTTEQESVVFLEGYPTATVILIICYYTLLIAIGIFWLIKQIIAIIKLRNETVKNELQHLQSQVNPHFFFNMLNNLYGLLDKDVGQSKKLVLALSDLMRYSIYDGQREMVTIAEEVDYLDNYIQLHQMRYHKKIAIQFEKEIANEQMKIMPLLFIVLVENAFKHGVERLRFDAFVHIKLHTKKDSLKFEVINNFVPTSSLEKGGVGLKNIKRRLALKYPQQHTLNCSESGTTYKASLSLQGL